MYLDTPLASWPIWQWHWFQYLQTVDDKQYLQHHQNLSWNLVTWLITKNIKPDQAKPTDRLCSSSGFAQLVNSLGFVCSNSKAVMKKRLNLLLVLNKCDSFGNDHNTSFFSKNLGSSLISLNTYLQRATQIIHSIPLSQKIHLLQNYAPSGMNDNSSKETEHRTA